MAHPHPSIYRAPSGPSSSETQGFNGDGSGRERLGEGKRSGEGRGGEGKEERGSPGKLLYTDHYSINYFSEPLLA